VVVVNVVLVVFDVVVVNAVLRVLKPKPNQKNLMVFDVVGVVNVV